MAHVDILKSDPESNRHDPTVNKFTAKNAKDAASIAKHRFLMLGDTGSGKTTQILTLPGKKFAYLFDANALLSLRGHDVDYEEFLPDRLSLTAGSLSKGKGDAQSVRSSDLYTQWERDFNSRIENGGFDQYDWIAFDSATTLLDLIMDRVLTINGRFGQWPQQDDYGPQMLLFVNICRMVTALGKGIYMTGHLDVKQDETTKRILRQPMMTGRLRTKVPLLFSDVLLCEASPGQDGRVVYQIQTTPDRMTTNVRTAIKGLDPFEDVTVDFKEEVEGQGLGGLLNWEEKQRKG